MAFCPICDAEIQGGSEDFEEGEVVECPECGLELEVSNGDGFELDPFEDDDFDDGFELDDDEEWE